MDSDNVSKFLKEVEGKSVEELVSQGREKLASMPAGGGGGGAPAAGGGGGGGGAAPAAEEKKVEEESEDEVRHGTACVCRLFRCGRTACLHCVTHSNSGCTLDGAGVVVTCRPPRSIRTQVRCAHSAAYTGSSTASLTAHSYRIRH